MTRDLGGVPGCNHSAKESGSCPKSKTSSFLRCACWNIAGYYGHNTKLEIISKLDVDIICVVETHLRGTEVIELPNFTWYGNNRMSVHRKSNKGSAGVGILCRNK